MNIKENKETKKMRKTLCFKKSRCYDILFNKGILYFLISFAAPMTIMLIAFAAYNIHPFGLGNSQILVVDLWHQYYPFFRVVREKLLTGGSFMYSWENGLGTNFLSLISYYAASPLNFLSVFFDDEHVRDALTFILAMKIGFAGAFFSCFLRYTYKRKDFSICVFSTMFALCSYVLGYYWNVMWFDTFALFPLVMMGVVAICREGKWKTYTFALAVSLVASYYIGYFTCIFAVLTFIAAAITECGGIKDFGKKLLIMIRSSLLGGGLAAFMLLPAYYGLQMTYSARNTFPKTMTFYEKWTDIFANLLSYNAPTKVEGLPNFACGMLAILLFGVFLFSFGIKIREKIAAVLALAFVAVSCNMNILNYIWHGFHFTNQIPYRFAFIFSFVLIAAAYRGYTVILEKGVKIYQLVLMLIAPAAVVLMNYLSDGRHLKMDKAMRSSLIIAGAMWLIFVAAKLFPFKKPCIRNAAVSVGLAAAVFSECLSNAQFGVDTVSTTSYQNYPNSQEAVQTLLEDVRKNDSTLFYRTEMTESYTLNDSALYGYYGLSQFSSAANVSVTRLCRRLGLYASEAGNRFYYRTSTPVVNGLFGIKYLIKKSESLKSEKWALDSIKTVNAANMYQSRYPLSLGFMVNESLLDIENESTVNPFEYQNEIIKRSSGIDQSIFIPQAVSLVEYNGIDVNKNGYGNYTFTTNSEMASPNAVYHFECLDGAYLYGYAESTGGCCDELRIMSVDGVVDSGKLIESYPLLFPMGNGQAGNEAKIKLSVADEKKSGNYKIMAYALDKNLFEQAYSRLADEQLEITKFSDTKIEGTVNAAESGVLYLSIPYEKGWSVYVDGEKTETVKLLDAMLGVKVGAGKHTIKLTYTPEGFPLGLAVTIISFGLVIMIVIIEKRRRKKAPEPSSENAEQTAEPYPAPPVTQPIYNQAYEEKLGLLAQENTEEKAKAEDADEKSEGNSGIQGN